MKRLITALTTVAAAALFGASGPASAMGVGTPQTYSKLVWYTTYNAIGITNCTQMVVDATGDLIQSDALLVYGSLNCTNGAYGVTGSLYFATDGSFSITMQVAGYTITCPRVAAYSGSCTVYDASWISRGTGSIQLQ